MTFHPLFKVALREPELIVEHLLNHVDHVKAQGVEAIRAYARKLAGGAVALVALLIALNLTGVAVMLAAVQNHWQPALIWVPLTAWLVAVLGALIAWRAGTHSQVQDVKDEVRADAQMLALIKEARS